MTTDQKTCFKCGVSKPRSEFYAHPNMADGLLGKCKECTKTDVRKRRRENPAVQAYDRERGSRSNPEYLRRYREKYPQAYKAQNAMRYAIKAGKLINPDKCENCGSTFRVEGHHDDYLKPLDVRWLCSLCHKRHHANHGPGANRALSN